MTAEIDVTDGRRMPRLGRGARMAVALASILLIALIALWTQRKPIAVGYVDRYLAAHGVRARYDIADLGFGRQRLTNVVIGDPARPDLVADWLELRTDIGLSGAAIDQVRAARVRLRGRLVNGVLSLGALDRLLPPPSGKPFALPALNVDVADARMRLETPQGVVGLKLTGRGILDDGFAGSIAAVSERLTADGCVIDRLAVAGKIGVTKGAPSLSGPARAASVTCGATGIANVGLDVQIALDAAFDRWTGAARVRTSAVRHPLARTESLVGAIDFAGDKAETHGHLALVSGRFVSVEASGGTARIAGDYRVGRAMAFEHGIVGGSGVALAPHRLAAIAALAHTGAGTPVGPLSEAASRAVVAAGRAIDGEAAMSWSSGGPVRVTSAKVSSRSGLRATLADSDLSYDPASGAIRLAGAITMSGGGLPDLALRLAQMAPGRPLTGLATLRKPYEVDGASLAFTPVRFATTPGGNSRFATRVTLSGPLGKGRIEGLDMPVDGLWNGRGRLALNPDCTAVAFRRLAVSGLDLRPASLRLCPTGSALVGLDDGRLSAGASLPTPRLAGTLGNSPLTLAASSARLEFADLRFRLHDLAVRIGSPDRLTRFDFSAINGKRERGGLAGTFAGGGGQIGNVPLVLSAATGIWGFDGRLGGGGAMTVSDTAGAPRFRPLAARNVAFGLADGTIGVAGTLYEPFRNVAVAGIGLRHELADGTGSADIAVPGLHFAADGLQPDDLTPLTVGVIANVVGTVTGEGHIRWSTEGVTSDGVFRTADIDLAAALGPVTGIATEIRFTDLLNLQSAPGQTATIRTINTGIVVTDGVIRYQTLPGARVQVESGRWPFAGGTLVLEPTLLDFSEKRERRMTLTVTGMEAAKFLAQFDFDNLAATGVFDGQMPMVFDDTGGRVEGGKLTVRPGGGTIAYLGEVSKENLGVWGNLAFQALRSLRYRSLDLVMNGPLSGEMVTEVRFAGVSQGAGAKRNFIFDRLQRLPFVFNVKIRAPFRGLFDSARSFYDPSRLIERNLPALIEERDRRSKMPSVPPPPAAAPPPVQPKESETMP